TFMKFSRDFEREADRLGAQTMFDAGYDPHGMISLFEKLQQLQKTNPNAVDKFFASHPSPAERIDNVSTLIAGFPPHRGLKKDTAEFQQAKSLLARGSRSAGGQTGGQALADGKGGAVPVASSVSSTDAAAKPTAVPVASTEVAKPGAVKSPANALRITGM